LAVSGDKSSVVINWSYNDGLHPVLVTESGTVALIYDYSKTPTIEMNLIMDVFDKVVNNALGSETTDFGDPADPSNYYPAKRPTKKRLKRRR